MPHLHTTLPAAALALAALAGTAHADRRSFTRTYEYMTMPEGETELEIYSTQSLATLDGPTDKTFDLQLEIEHGITERWDISLYHVLSQTHTVADGDDESLRFKEIKVRSRYRFAERGEWPVNVVAYGELIKPFEGRVWEAEAKAILTRDFDRVTAALNLIAEVELDASGPETEIEPEYGWAAGVTYEATPAIKVGAECWGALEEEVTADGEELAVAATAGPAVSWAPASSLWVTSTAGFGLTEHADDFSLRLLLGMHL